MQRYSISTKRKVEPVFLFSYLEFYHFVLIKEESSYDPFQVSRRKNYIYLQRGFTAKFFTIFPIVTRRINVINAMLTQRGEKVVSSLNKYEV